MRRTVIYISLLIACWGLSISGEVQSQEPRTPPSYGIYDVAWSPDGTQLATANPGGRVYLRNQAGEIVQTLSGHDYRAIAVDWSPDGRFLASGGDDSIIRVFNVEQSFVQEIEAFSSGVFELAWQPQGERLLASGFDTFDAWDTATWRRITNSPGVTLLDLDWKPDGTQFAFAAISNVGVATLQGGQIEVTNFEQQHKETIIQSVDWSPSGIELVSAGGRDGSVRLWDAATGTQIRVLLQTDEVMTDAVFVAPDASQVAAITEQGHIYIINTETGEIEQTLTREAQLWALDWNPQANLLAIAGLNTRIGSAGAEAVDVMETGFLEILPLTAGE